MKIKLETTDHYELALGFKNVKDCTPLSRMDLMEKAGYEVALKVHKGEVYIYVTMVNESMRFPLGLISSFEIIA